MYNSISMKLSFLEKESIFLFILIFIVKSLYNKILNKMKTKNNKAILTVSYTNHLHSCTM